MKTCKMAEQNPLEDKIKELEIRVKQLKRGEIKKEPSFEYAKAGDPLVSLKAQATGRPEAEIAKEINESYERLYKKNETEEVKIRDMEEKKKFLERAISNYVKSGNYDKAEELAKENGKMEEMIQLYIDKIIAHINTCPAFPSSELETMCVRLSNLAINLNSLAEVIPSFEKASTQAKKQYMAERTKKILYKNIGTLTEKKGMLEQAALFYEKAGEYDKAAMLLEKLAKE